MSVLGLGLGLIKQVGRAAIALLGLVTADRTDITADSTNYTADQTIE